MNTQNILIFIDRDIYDMRIHTIYLVYSCRVPVVRRTRIIPGTSQQRERERELIIITPKLPGYIVGRNTGLTPLPTRQAYAYAQCQFDLRGEQTCKEHDAPTPGGRSRHAAKQRTQALRVQQRQDAMRSVLVSYVVSIYIHDTDSYIRVVYTYSNSYIGTAVLRVLVGTSI